MDFRNIIFYVKDLKSTVEFYERALGLKREVYTEEHGYAEVSTNKSFISFVNEEIARKFIKKSDIHNSIISKK